MIKRISHSFCGSCWCIVLLKLVLLELLELLELVLLEMVLLELLVPCRGLVLGNNTNRNEKAM